MDESSIPTVGHDVYVDTSLFLHHPEDNFHGGLCKIARVQKPSWAGEDLFVEVEEDPGVLYNWTLLRERQEQLRQEFGEQRGYLMRGTPAGVATEKWMQDVLGAEEEAPKAQSENTVDHRPWWRFWR